MKPVKLCLWFELVAAISGIAFVLAIFFATVGAATGDVSDDSPAGASASTGAAAVGSGQPVQAAQTPALAVAEKSSPPLQTYEGVVSDTRCGAKHSPAMDENAADCTRQCVHAGQHFALVDGDKVYILEGQPELLKRAAGVRVTVTGALNNNTISIATVRLPSP
jgi:hypothetical protein